MTDYLEELLDLLTLEDEPEAGEGWTAQAASPVLPRVLELPEGTAAEEGGSGEGGARSWPEGKPRTGQYIRTATSNKRYHILSIH